MSTENEAQELENLAKNATKCYEADRLKINNFQQIQLNLDDEEDPDTPYVDKLLAFYQKYKSEKDRKSRMSYENMLLRKTIEELNHAK